MALVTQERNPVSNGHHRDRYPTASPIPQVSRTIVRLVWMTALLGVVSALTGLLWRGAGSTRTSATLLGEEVDLYGRGLYENDTLFIAGNNFASDIVLVALGLPLLLVSLRMSVRGSLRARLLLVGALGFFVYYGASYALGGVAYNELFLVYVALFSSSLFALMMTMVSFDAATVRHTFGPAMPRRLVGRFLIGSGIVTLGIWMMDPVASLLSGDPPETLETHTTLFTHAFDLAIIVPAAILAGVMVLRRQRFGYVVAFSLFILEALLLPIISIATLIQVNMGISFTPAEVVGPIAGFGVLAALAVLVIVCALRHVTRPATTTEVTL